MNPTFVAQFEERGLTFVGTDVDGQRMEIIELQGYIFIYLEVLHVISLNVMITDAC